MMARRRPGLGRLLALSAATGGLGACEPGAASGDAVPPPAWGPQPYDTAERLAFPAVPDTGDVTVGARVVVHRRRPLSIGQGYDALRETGASQFLEPPARLVDDADFTPETIIRLARPFGAEPLAALLGIPPGSAGRVHADALGGLAAGLAETIEARRALRLVYGGHWIFAHARLDPGSVAPRPDTAAPGRPFGDAYASGVYRGGAVFVSLTLGFPDEACRDAFDAAFPDEAPGAQPLVGWLTATDAARCVRVDGEEVTQIGGDPARADRAFGDPEPPDPDCPVTESRCQFSGLARRLAYALGDGPDDAPAQVAAAPADLAYDLSAYTPLGGPEPRTLPPDLVAIRKALTAAFDALRGAQTDGATGDLEAHEARLLDIARHCFFEGPAQLVVDAAAFDACRHAARPLLAP